MISFGKEFLPKFAFSDFSTHFYAKRIADKFIASPAVFADTRETAVIVLDQKDIENLIAVTARIIIFEILGTDNLRHIFSGKYVVSIRKTLKKIKIRD